MGAFPTIYMLYPCLLCSRDIGESLPLSASANGRDGCWGNKYTIEDIEKQGIRGMHYVIRTTLTTKGHSRENNGNSDSVR